MDTDRARAIRAEIKALKTSAAQAAAVANEAAELEASYRAEVRRLEALLAQKRLRFIKGGAGAIGATALVEWTRDNSTSAAVGLGIIAAIIGGTLAMTTPWVTRGTAQASAPVRARHAPMIPQQQPVAPSGTQAPAPATPPATAPTNRVQPTHNSPDVPVDHPVAQPVTASTPPARSAPPPATQPAAPATSPTSPLPTPGRVRQHQHDPLIEVNLPPLITLRLWG
jgi:hypothetical protein